MGGKAGIPGISASSAYMRAMAGPTLQPRRTPPTLSKELADITRAIRESKKDAIPQGAFRGLRNEGNTCYLNAVLQAMLSLRPFLLYLKEASQDKYSSHGEGGKTIIECRGFPRPQLAKMPDRTFFKALLKLVGQMKGVKFGAVDVRSLKATIAKRYPRFAGNAQQDAHEFLSQCLNQLNDDVLETYRLQVTESPAIAFLLLTARPSSAESRRRLLKKQKLSRNKHLHSVWLSTWMKRRRKRKKRPA